MNNPFFEQPILNTPYGYPGRHWELDEQGQPTQQIIDERRKAKYATPIPKPKKQKKAQRGLGFDEGHGLSSDDQQYDETASRISESALSSISGVSCPSPLGESLLRQRGC